MLIFASAHLLLPILLTTVISFPSSRLLLSSLASSLSSLPSLNNHPSHPISLIPVADHHNITKRTNAIPIPLRTCPQPPGGEFDWSYCLRGPTFSPRTYRISCSQYLVHPFQLYPVRVQGSTASPTGECPEDTICMNGARTLPAGTQYPNTPLALAPTAYCVPVGERDWVKLDEVDSSPDGKEEESFEFVAPYNAKTGAERAAAEGNMVEAIMTDLQGAKGNCVNASNLQLSVQVQSGFAGGVAGGWREVFGGAGSCSGCASVGVAAGSTGQKSLRTEMRVDVKGKLKGVDVGAGVGMFLMGVYS